MKIYFITIRNFEIIVKIIIIVMTMANMSNIVKIDVIVINLIY